MLVVLPFCAKDKALAVRLAEWILELGGVKSHDCLLAVHKDTDAAGVIEPLTEAFGRAAQFEIKDDMIVEREQHAWAANVMWKRVANHIAEMNESQPWAWVEADSVPVPTDKKRSWLDLFALAYQEGGKPFMHCLVQTARGSSNSGCGVYPAKVRDYTDRLWELSNISWDIHLFEDFARHTNYSPLIQDVGFLADGVTLPTFPDIESLSLLRPATALFHRCKDGTLIDRLREEKNGVCVRGRNVIAPEKAQKRPEWETITPASFEGSNPSTPSETERLWSAIERIERLLTQRNGGDAPCAQHQPRSTTHPTDSTRPSADAKTASASNAVPTFKPKARRKKRNITPEGREAMRAAAAKARAKKAEKQSYATTTR